MKRFIEVASRATKGSVLATAWLEELRGLGVLGLTLTTPDSTWTVGEQSDEFVYLSASLTTFGQLDLTEEEIVMLGALSDCMSRWLHRMQRFATSTRRARDERLALRKEVADIRGDDLGLIGTSLAMQEVRRLLQIVAAHETTVLLYGESGTGKELAARALHRSSRRTGSFVAINCGAITPTLVEAELFGHTRGAFTGAERARPGVLRAAGRGTVLLDEVAELSLDAQAKLLRALQERRVTPVGSDRAHSFRARIVSATRCDLARRVREGSFREDLLYRISTFPIRLPPLRERPQDVRDLVRTKVASIARQLDRDPPELSAAVLTKLARYKWPGNVRELENELERALLLSGHVLEWTEPSRAQIASCGSLDEVIRDAIENALRQTEGRIYGEHGAAQRLGLAPSTLQTKMRKHGIERSSFTRK